MTATDGLSASGQWRLVGSLVPWRAPVATPTATADGILSPADADEIDRWIEERTYVPDPWDVDTCSPHCAARIPHELGELYCTLDPDHAGLHEPHDTQGRRMPLPVDEMGAVA